ncbi:MAG TPA: hypothetical protein VGH65_03675 [Verrucomicrobiaceae bacterium]|jgi:ElaB/YqjD/DUF883 family membrane-anchored ribosome-binding protein
MNDTHTSDTSFGTPPTDPFAAAKSSALKAAEELRSAAAAKAQEIRQAAEQRAAQFKSVAETKAVEIKDYADKAWGEASNQVKNLTSEAERFAREKPLQALLAAFGVGFLAGVIFRR